MKKPDVVLALLLILLSAGVYALSAPMPKLAAAFPRFLSVLLIVLSLILLMTSLRSADTAKLSINWRPVGTVVLVMVAYYYMLRYLGYIVSTIALTSSLYYVLGYRDKRVLILTSLGISIGLYLLFGLAFGVPLPRGFLL